MISFESFIHSLKEETPPADSNSYLRALWFAHRGQWDAAHDLVQHDASVNAAWIHAYLHRVEGDDANAAYWYRNAGKPVCRTDLKTEWNALVEFFIN